ncbi:hypothetical protein [uncultured Pseudokineococcus sp.]|uniref:hypothetical protein n=1 Tax=uncultured Pseudokineococcus sp. TaxID=1642928 RepID=UPI002623ACA7|nr:hypothetical protein [uncultured Pseudokineococcus sp.]
MDWRALVVEVTDWLMGHLSGVGVVAALLIAFVTLLYTRSAERQGRKATAAAETQALADLPAIKIDYVSGGCKIGRKTRVYTFDLVVRNLSDRPNSLASAELRLDYKVGDDRLVTTKVRWAAPGKQQPEGDYLGMPTLLAPRETIHGRIEIAVPQAVLNGKPVEHLRLVIEDTFGTAYSVSTAFVQEAYVEPYGKTGSQ